MPDFLQGIFDTSGFHPHGFCYLWKPGLLWLHVVADSLIGVAYLGIGALLVSLVRQARGDLPFSWVFVAFGAFIVACGATHIVEIWTLWQPVYWFAGGVKAATAAASVATALAVPPLVPRAIATLRDAGLSRVRGKELEAANAALREADETKTRFFANASHELRTPLALILGPVERMLARDGLRPEDRRELETVRRNADLLLHHVGDLLDVSRLGAGRMEPELARTDLARLARLAASHFESLAAEREVSLAVEAPDALEGDADPAQLRRVLLNLLGNAFKFTPAGGRVRLVLAREEGAARLEVHDSGPGIAPEERERVFEPYRQAGHGELARWEGTGLGLAISRELVGLHGGTLSAGESPEGGALFVARLPLRAPGGTPARREWSDGADGDGAPFVPAPAHLPAPSGDGGADAELPLVLLAEDNPDMARFVAESLEGVARVARAGDGAAALGEIERLAPDLVLSDVMMPGMGGDELLREVRRRPALSALPFLLLSARADEGLRARLLREGAQDYLLKPFSVEELRARVGNWLAVKRAGDLLRDELADSRVGVDELAREAASRKRDLETALEAARLATREAEAATRAKSEFLGVMSHELRTPINAILGFADLLDEGVSGALNEKQRAHVGRISAAARRLRELVDEVLELARSEAVQEELRPADADLAEAAREAAALLEEEAREKGVALEVVLPPEPLVARTDLAKLHRVLVNLVGNAVKFTDAGTVTVELRRVGEEAVFRVRDTGPGIAPEHLAKVWEPFWQADPSRTRRAGGTGLGLTIARKLTALLGGELHLASTPGEGTLFTLHLPVRGARPPEPV